MLHRLHHLLQKKGTLELLLLFAVIVAVSVDLVGAEKLGELDAKYHCVTGKMDNIKDQKGGPGEQDVTVAGGETMVKLEKTPKDTFRAMVRYFGHLGYDIVVDYEMELRRDCWKAIKGLVEKTEGCQLVEHWHYGQCDGEGKCTGGWHRVACKLSGVQQVQEDRGPTGYLVADVTVWSSEKCLSVSAKFTDTDKRFCYLVLQSEVKDQNQIKTVKGFMGMTTTTKTTTTETTTEGSSNKTTMTIQPQNTTTAGTKTTPANGTTKKMTAQTTTTTDKHGPKPTTMGPAEEQEEHGDEDEQEEVSTSLPYCMALAWPFPLLFHLAINITVILVGVVLISLCMFSELIHERRR